MWREFFGQDAPPFNRRFLEARLAYRIQELALGGLKRETVKRLVRAFGIPSAACGRNQGAGTLILASCFAQPCVVIGG